MVLFRSTKRKMDDFRNITEILDHENRSITTSRLAMQGIPEFMEMAEIQEELQELGFRIPIIARMCQKQNGGKIYMPLVLIQLSKT